MSDTRNIYKCSYVVCNVHKERMYFVHFFLNKNVYASKGVDLRAVCSHIASESGKMPVKVF